MIKIYRSGIHYGEEPYLSGNDQSGMINFSGCRLACTFCYTPETSQGQLGSIYSTAAFYDLLCDLVQRGAKNINLITPSHIWREIEAPLYAFRAAHGKNVPILLKIGGGEPVRLIERMLKLADLIVPDFKVWNPTLAESFRLPKNYGPATLRSVQHLITFLPSERTPQGIYTRGVSIRHLLMPNCEADSLRIIDHLAQIRYTGPINFTTHFIDSNTAQMRIYPRESLLKVTSKAQQHLMKVLVNGKAPSLIFGQPDPKAEVRDVS